MIGYLMNMANLKNVAANYEKTVSNTIRELKCSERLHPFIDIDKDFLNSFCRFLKQTLPSDLIY